MYYDAFDNERPVIIFGTGMMAQLCRYLLEVDSPFKVIGHTVDQQFMTESSFDGLPVYPYEDLKKAFSTDDVYLLVCVGHVQNNLFRMNRFNTIKSDGYKMIHYVSSRASVWADLAIDENTIIFEHAIIQPFAQIGKNCIIRSGAHISHHTKVRDHCFIAAGAITAGNVTIERQSFLGVGSVISDSLTLAESTFVGAGAVVIKSTEKNCVYVGNPARKLIK